MYIDTNRQRGVARRRKDHAMRINEVERRVGITKKNIRFYEEEGLLKPSRSADNGYRDYSEEDVAVLQRIKLLRQLSVPLEDIRRLHTGALTLADCMHGQVGYLEAQAQNLLQVKAVCAELADTGAGLAEMDVGRWQTRIAELERTGTRFMNIRNDHRKKMIGPILITSALIVLLVAAEILIAQDLAQTSPPWLLAALALGTPVAVAGGLTAALWMRVQEIKGGEEDEAAKY